MVEQVFSWVVLALFSIGLLVYAYPLVVGRPVWDGVPLKDGSPSAIRLRSLLWVSVCLWLVARSLNRLFPTGSDAVLTQVLLGAAIVAWVGIAVGVVAWVWQRVTAPSASEPATVSPPPPTATGPTSP